MSDNSSFDSEAASDDDSKEEEDTKSITERKKSSIKEIEIVPNIDLINAISKTLLTILNNNESLKNYREIVKKQNTSSSQWLSDVFFDVFLDCRDGAESEVFDKYFQHTLRNEARKCGTDVDILHAE